MREEGGEEEREVQGGDLAGGGLVNYSLSNRALFFSFLFSLSLSFCLSPSPLVF